MKPLFTALLVLGCSLAARSADLDILFIGNSFTAYNGGVYTHLEYMAAAGTPAVDVNESHVIAGGQNLMSHWENSDVYGGIDAIRLGGHDIVVLQGYFNNTGGIENFCTYARKFDQLIDSVGAQTVFYMNWTNPYNQYADLTNQRIGAVYDSMAAELDAEVVHVGMAFETLLQTTPDTVLYCDATAHPYPLGTYLATCCFYSRLFGRTPAGIPYNSDPATIGDSLMLYLQELGWTTEETDDTTAPGISRIAGTDSMTVSIRFNEAVNGTDAGNTANYSVSGLSVTAAAAQADNRTVLLTVGPMTDGQEYTVTVSNIRDLADPVNTCGTVVRTFTYWNAGAKNVGDVAVHMPLDGNLADISGYSFTATWGNGESFVPGYDGQGIAPLAESTYVTVAMPGVVQLTDVPRASICAWAKKGTADSGGLILNRHAIYSLEATAAGVRGKITNTDGTSKYADGTAGTADTLWHHYALTYDSESLYVYVDGVRTGQAAQAGLLRDDKARDLWIGWNPFGTDKFFNGSIDEVRLYDWTLTDDHVRQIYELNGPVAPVVEIPYFTPEGGTFQDSVLVRINCRTDSVTVRYTVDGTVPAGTSAVYTEPLLLTATTTIMAKGFRSGYTASEAALATFTVAAGSSSVSGYPGPAEYTPAVIAGPYPGTDNCRVFTGTSGSIAVYGTDGARVRTDVGEPVDGYRAIRIYGGPGSYIIIVARNGTTDVARYLMLAE